MKRNYSCIFFRRCVQLMFSCVGAGVEYKIKFPNLDLYTALLGLGLMYGSSSLDPLGLPCVPHFPLFSQQL